MSKKWTYLKAAEEVLRQAGHPLSTRDLAEEIEKRGLIRFSGKTPWKTIGSKISVEIKKKGDSSCFKRYAPGVYTLRAEPFKEYVAPEEFIGHPPVLVFRAELLQRSDLGRFHGVREDHQQYSSALIDQDLDTPNISFLEREYAEQNPDYKQIVSYVMIRHKDAVLRHVRGGERSTLGRHFYDAYSIAFGGHVAWTDRDIWTWRAADFGYWASMAREVNEETGITLVDPAREAPIVGVINDDSTDLGSKHFAFVHLLELATPTVEKTERAVRELQWIAIPDLHRDFRRYEYWSKLCIQAFFAQHQEITCHIVPKASGGDSFSLKNQADYVLIVGFIGSGKTTACTLLARHFGHNLIRGSEVLKVLLGYESDEDVPRKVLQEKGLAFINEPDGHDKLAHGILEHMAAHPGERYVLDGLRYPESLKALQAMLDKPITVIYIESPLDRLLEYYRYRGRAETTYEDFLKIVYHPVELAASRFFDTADITVYNYGSLEFYIKALLRFFSAELG